VIIYPLIGLVCVILGCLTYWSLLKKHKGKKSVERWLNQVSGIFLTGAFGFCIFFLQQGVTKYYEKKSINMAIKEELSIIKDQLRPALNSQACGTGTTAMSINSVILLPSKIINISASQMTFDQFRTRDILLLASLIDEHNRWADYALQILKDPTNPEAISKLKILNNFAKIDEDIFAKSEYLYDCLTVGTSTRDKDCK
jgi:hypothetical protein